jgi:hypothetical protein
VLLHSCSFDRSAQIIAHVKHMQGRSLRWSARIEFFRAGTGRSAPVFSIRMRVQGSFYGSGERPQRCGAIHK